MTVIKVITPKQIPRDANAEVTAERPCLSTFENLLETKKIHLLLNIILPENSKIKNRNIFF